MIRFVVWFFTTSVYAQTFSTPAISAGVPTPADTWVMNEATGNTFADTSATANTVTAGGTVTWSTGPGALTTGAHFDGTFDSISENHTNFNPGTSDAWSVSTWVTLDSVNNNEEILISQFGASGQGWYIFKNPSSSTFNEWGVIIQNAGAAGYISRTFYMAQHAATLYHIVVTYDGSGTAAGVSMYINGNILQCITVHDNLSGSATPNASIYLGSCNCSLSADRHVGYQSSTRLYNRVLTQVELLTLYGAGPMLDTYTKATRSTTTVTASSFATLDADCATGGKVGGGTATDNTGKLNAVLLTASSGSPLDLVLDGCTVTTGLFVMAAGYTTIEGTGLTTGVYVKSGSNAAAITNGWGLYPTSATGYGLTPIILPTQGSGVALKNMRVSGNRAGNALGGDPHGSPWIPGVALSNIDGLTLDGAWIYDAPTYAFIGDNISNVAVTSCNFESPSHAINTDGFHVDGPADHITITSSTFYTGDDAIAMNSPEGYSGIINHVSIIHPNIDTRSANGLREYGTVLDLSITYCAQPDVIGKNSEGQSTLLSPATVNSFSCSAPPTGSGISLSGAISLSGSVVLQ